MVEDRSWSSGLSARQMEKAQGHPPDVEDECRINIKMEEKTCSPQNTSYIQNPQVQAPFITHQVACQCHL